ncbi:protein spa1-related 3 [Phtheirospermum japonicum]|uniref:Protein spa1-related 3 n=1 Tax=Phtheirospermum japonicum TaxID=374723 RepID=A0A830B2W5_9LAMI|nr:protein spa1-related 3 [Phtheirospermum japonicum]
MSSFNRVSFIESASCSESGSDSQEYGSNSSPLPHNSETSCLQSYSGRPVNALEATGDERAGDNINNNKKHSFPMKQILVNESNWYTSPEEISGGVASCASDIYQLGVLLFELFCNFGSVEEKSSTMANLRHRVLPPQLLLKCPKEASFCLWLLHPDPSSRPKMGELLQSEFLNEPRIDIEEREAVIELREEIEEQELLLEFLLTLQQRKQDAADSLNETVSFISSDIEEATKLQAALKLKEGSNSDPDPPKNLPLNTQITNMTTDDDDSCFSGSRKRNRPGLEPGNHMDEHENLEIPGGNQETALSKGSRLMKNFRKVESAYFLTRRRAVKPVSWPLGRHSLISSEKSSISNPPAKECNNENKPSGWINTFLEGMCKYLAFSKLKVKADLKQGDLLNSSNLVCSLSFDRDGEFFATAGVNKKIKVWDVTRSQAFMEMREHERRVWSVDFSVADPTLLASGSDDGSVKLWNINQAILYNLHLGVSIGTIRTKANVCCVQFPTDSGRTLAFGSADHRIYYYDLRNSKVPLCTLVGHNKTVSYVKFIDSTTLVSASTDNTIKLWDLSMCTSRVLDSPLQSFTGHLNMKNFVGLSVSEGYIATGSETNEVFVYHKTFPMPALSFKFNSTDPFSGDEVDDTAQFISSVCWRGQSSTLVAANSMGNIKLLEMA